MALEEVTIIVGQPLPGAAGVEVVAQSRNDERLNLGGGNAADQSGRPALSLQHGLGDVIAVAGAALVGVGRAHAVAANVKKASAQDCGRAPLDQLGEIRKRARQPVDLVHHHEVDPASPNIAQQGLERRPFQRGPGEAAIIIMIWDEPPALLRLALDIGLTGLALGIERVERKVEVMLGRLAGIDGAATKLADGPVHAARSTNLRTARGNSDSPARANISRAI